MARKTWFITRPTRYALTSHDRLVKALGELRGEKWTGNREIQKELERKLAEAGIKAQGVSRDGSGGRTWAALARTFGYWYPDAEGRIVLTPVAEALIEGRDTSSHIRKQILNYQIPNGYVVSGDFRPPYEDGFRVFPFRFILRLLLDEELEHRLHRDEIALFVLPVKRDNELNEVKATILRWRRAFQRDRVELQNRGALIKQNAEKYDHRQRIDSQGTDYLSYARDSANTHIILTESMHPRWFDRVDECIVLKTASVSEVRELLEEFETLYPFDTRYLMSEEAMTRHYGLDLGRFKNTFRGSKGAVRSRRKREDMYIRDMFQELCATNVGMASHELVKAVADAYGFEEEVVRESLIRQGEIHDDIEIPGLERFIENYLDAGHDSERWKEFEDLTIKVLNGMDGVHAFKPKASSDSDGTNVEIGLTLSLPSGVSWAGIIDCKSGKEFRLGADKRDLMATSYIPKYSPLLTPNGDSVPMRFFGYVVGENFSGKANLNQVADKACQFDSTLSDIDGFVLNARTLLGLLERIREGIMSVDDLLNVFVSNEVFTSIQAVDRYLNRLKDERENGDGS